MKDLIKKFIPRGKSFWIGGLAFNTTKDFIKRLEESNKAIDKNDKRSSEYVGIFYEAIRIGGTAFAWSINGPGSAAIVYGGLTYIMDTMSKTNFMPFN